MIGVLPDDIFVAFAALYLGILLVGYGLIGRFWGGPLLAVLWDLVVSLREGHLDFEESLPLHLPLLIASPLIWLLEWAAKKHNVTKWVRLTALLVGALLLWWAL